ncbi:septal ring lytic transglycosylase RlpA family protein [Streptomyces herbicida]|uniref:septal ring lytic transglycosylase RlpA family protein n=1 Tax=Streptomyces herbicida TaxID=3065675 RepID=UPI00292E4302|nr:septal ring lytic transglycosylase RlpA family protein [Streptomyces sp. NEAU-HV9]
MSKRILHVSLAAGVAALTATVALAPASSAAPKSAQAHRKTCWATHYGPIPAGSQTSNGDIFDNSKNTAATSLTRRPQLPFGTKVKVTNVANGKSLVVRINDRGTFKRTKEVPLCLDLTDGAFRRLGGSLNPDAGHIVVRQKVLR